MSAAARRKGAAYERKIANLFSARLGLVVKRRVDQWREGGDDLTSPELDSWLSVECKDRSASSLGAWTDQAIASAGPDRVAVVVHHRRGNGRPEGDFATLTVADFLALVELALLGRRAVAAGDGAPVGPKVER